MNIQDALKETGKARKNVDTDNYAQLDISDRLYWHGIKDNVKNSPVQMESILADNWQPYHPREEIRPKEEGELWVQDGEHYYMTTNRNSAPFVDAYGENKPLSQVIHNQNGWKRLYPEVPNKNEIVVGEVIREIIEQAHMAGQNDAGVDAGYSNARAYCNGIFKELPDIMKMILEMPKEA